MSSRKVLGLTMSRNIDHLRQSPVVVRVIWVVFWSSLRLSCVVSSNYIVGLQDLSCHHLGSLVVDLVTVSSLSSSGIAPTMSLAMHLTLLLLLVFDVITRVVIDTMQGSHKVVMNRNRGRQSVLTTSRRSCQSVFTDGLQGHQNVVTIGHQENTKVMKGNHTSQKNA